MDLVSKYNSCYCLKTSLPNDIASKGKIHKRYHNSLHM